MLNVGAFGQGLIVKVVHVLEQDPATLQMRFVEEITRVQLKDPWEFFAKACGVIENYVRHVPDDSRWRFHGCCGALAADGEIQRVDPIVNENIQTGSVAVHLFVPVERTVAVVVRYHCDYFGSHPDWVPGSWSQKTKRIVLMVEKGRTAACKGNQ